MDTQRECYGTLGPWENELNLKPSLSHSISQSGELNDFVGMLRQLSDNVFSGIILCDRDCKILYMNKFYADLLGTVRDEALGKNVQDYFPNSRIPIVLATGNVELGRRCSLKLDIDYVVNRIPVKCEGETIGVVVQTIFKDYSEISELMARLNLLEKRVKYYKEGLESMLSTTYSFDSIIGKNGTLVEAKRLAEKYAQTDAPVLIVGDTGTGKELFAQAVHAASGRRNKPFVCVNCAAIPRDLLESELFGYETGAFTGARRRGKAGKIELAHRGTLFLDEIGDIPLNAQVKLLRTLETRQIEKVGSLKAVSVDFRLVAATNKDLKGMIEREEFRNDLFYRLNTMTVEVPSLSERADDISSLVHHFLLSTSKPTARVSDRAMEMLKSYSWPGNVRELKNTVERAVSLVEGDLIEAEHLPSEMTIFNSECRQIPTTNIKSLSKELACYEKELLSKALRVTDGNMSKTAKLLRISRSTLYEKCRTHNLRNTP